MKSDKKEEKFDLVADGPVPPFAQVTNVGAVPGGDAFLLDGGTVTVLCDAGFGFCGDQLVENLERRLDGRALDYILLTHSHYDHALGAPYCAARWPQAQVVASSYVQRIFARESARRVMREMDASAAAMYGAVRPAADRVDELRVDIAVEDGEALDLNGIQAQVVALPGHTKCSVGYYFPAGKLLLASETLGVFAGENKVIPAFLVGYAMTLDSFERAMALEPARILVPHRGVIEGEACARFLRLARDWSARCYDIIIENYRAGKSEDEIIEAMKAVFYTGDICSIQPEAAFLLNARATVPMVIREYLG